MPQKQAVYCGQSKEAQATLENGRYSRLDWALQVKDEATLEDLERIGA
jgi:hypothetical protein